MSTSDNHEPGDPLIRSIAGNLLPIGEDIAEIGVDAFLKSGITREIPIVGWVVSLVKGGLSVRDVLFLKKVYRFLFELAAIPQDKRQAFIERLEQDEAETKRFGENVVLLLEQHDDIEKAVITGLIMKAHIEGRVDQSTALCLCTLVNRAFLPDLWRLTKNTVELVGWPDPELSQRLYLAGLMVEMSRGGLTFAIDSPVEHIPNYTVNRLGYKLLDVALREWYLRKTQSDGA